MAGIKADAIHGNKSQSARQTALSNFKKGTSRALVATDIAARGIDIDELAFVLNFDLPNIPETYVHRIGRTGRAGASGLAISLCDMEEVSFLKDIEKLIGKKIPVEPTPVITFHPPAPVLRPEVERRRPSAPKKPAMPTKQQSGPAQEGEQGAKKKPNRWKKRREKTAVPA